MEFAAVGPAVFVGDGGDDGDVGSEVGVRSVESGSGICLSRLHDAAFERGVISFDDNLRLLLSPRLRQELSQRAVAESFGAYLGETLRLPPDAAPPATAFLSKHRAEVFAKS